MLLLTADQLTERRAIARGPLSALADSLAADLEPLLSRDIHFPTAKALLSRVGGRCETDGTDLEFDPRSPHAHRCPRCARMHTGEWHDRWWIYPYQLWLAERALHGATLFALRGDERHAVFSRSILLGYADRYLDYPNRDNVLGPSRVFFSTYLESLWLLSVTLAADLLDTAGDSAIAGVVADRIVHPAVELIEEYDEGLSNRQVWNAAAIVAARRFLGDPARATATLGGLEGIVASTVGDDGTWYEGDNYHQFAHRGLWYGVALGEAMAYEFDPELLGRFDAGFAAPFRTALPDFTYPARKDSRYAASLRQWRFAESCELGVGRGVADDGTLAWALSEMYADDIAAGDTGRARASGEAERHAAPVRLSRADLGWKALLFAAADVSVEPTEPPGSITVASQGYTIHRRDGGSVYVALDWGESGGGHGHPDRLNLLFSHGAARWLDDLGTGSYVDPSLHWFRSTLAHNAPLVDGRSQLRVSGELLGEGSLQGIDFVSAAVIDLAPGVRVERTVVTAADYFIDEVRWWADREVRFELPIHFAGDAEGISFAPRTLDGGAGDEDGFAFVSASESATVAAGTPVLLRAVRHGHAPRALVWVDQASTFFRATGPGQPATDTRRFYVVRCEGRRGVIRTLWPLKSSPWTVEFSAVGVAVRMSDALHRHRSYDADWEVDTGVATGPVQFSRARPVVEVRVESERADLELAVAQGQIVPPQELPVVDHGAAWFSDLTDDQRADWSVFALGEQQYRRTEQNWESAGEPSARVAVCATESGLVVDVFANAPMPVFVPADATNPFDNESPDINGHGMQLYLAAGDDGGAWVLVPELPAPSVRARVLAGWGSVPAPRATWRRVHGGFEMRAAIAIDTAAAGIFGLDVIVNDAEPGRTRRRGQLVMSGAEGEFAYLQGDRHDPGRLVPFLVV